MIFAYVLIKVQPGREEEVLKMLQELGIKAKVVYGEYDIVAEIEAETRKKLGIIISSKIRSTDAIKFTKSLISVEG